MTISICCDGCNSTYKLPDEMVGKKAKCKKCGQLLTVAAPPSRRDESPKIAAMCGQCGAKYSVGLAMVGKRAKCQKCGGVFEVTDPSVAPLAEVQDDAFGAADWSDPLGDLASAREASAPLSSPMASMPAAPKPSGRSVPLAVWIAAAGGAGALLFILLLVLIFFSRGSGDGGGITSTNGASGTDDDLPELNDSVAWTWKADLPARGPAGLARQPIKLLDRPNEVFFARGSVAQAVISYRRSSDGKDDVLVQQLDLKTGEIVAEQAFEKNTKLLDLSQDGTAFLILPGANYASNETLQVWRWTNKAAKQAGEWMPYEGQTSKRIAWSMLIDANRVATGHGQGKAATVWNADGKQIGRFPHEGSKPPRLSPGGKYLAKHSGIWLRFFDASSLKHVGSIGPLSADYVNFSGLAYRPDGRAIAATFQHPSGSTFVSWNAASREKQVEFEIPILSTPLAWHSDDVVLAGAYLLSLSNEMPVWNYSGLKPFAQTIDHRVWHHLAAGREQYLVASGVPSPEVESNIDKYVSANVPILQAGDSVALKVQISGSTPGADFQQQLTQTVTAHLQAAGYKIAEGAEFRLQVNLQDKDTGEQLEYHTFGGRGGSNTIKVSDRRIECVVAFVDSTDKVVWRAKTSIGPSFFSSTRGAETDFAASVLDARWKSFDSWIKTRRIPALVRKFSSTGDFGSSMLQADGERIVKVPVN